MRTSEIQNLLRAGLTRRALLVPLGATIVVGLGLLAPASAQQPAPAPQMYDVELVIFRALSSDATPEQWSVEGGDADQRLEIPDDEPSPFRTPAPAVVEPATFAALPASKFKLTAVEETLRRSRRFQPLAHVGWTQPGFPRDAAKYLPIESVVPASSGITGQVALSRGRYLHLTLDLVYAIPASETEDAQRYVMRQTRRMRSNERHYIDHPKFGVVALVTPSQ